jgi:predicted amidophosphoribosyltransferase
MSLLGEKCDRCGKRTRHKEDEHPICEDCAREMALMMEASSETLRACPADGEQMTKQIAHMLVIDRCPKAV